MPWAFKRPDCPYLDPPWRHDSAFSCREEVWCLLLKVFGLATVRWKAIRNQENSTSLEFWNLNVCQVRFRFGVLFFLLIIEIFQGKKVHIKYFVCSKKLKLPGRYLWDSGRNLCGIHVPWNPNWRGQCNCPLKLHWGESWGRKTTKGQVLDSVVQLHSEFTVNPGAASNARPCRRQGCPCCAVRITGKLMR